MNQLKNIAFILTLLLFGFTTLNAEVSFNVGLGAGDYYQPVGDYDYLPYSYQENPAYAAPKINFHNMMSQYGVWVSVSPFGQVWKPYAANDWRPYTQGHWISTQQHGQMWEGYEPWAWAGYHYGNWIYAGNHGWVWIPGYDWHPGRVTRARSHDSIGWMPTPPSGYDYSRGYLSNVGPRNQFAYNDNDFGMDYGSGNFSYGGPYYDERYRNMYYNPSYRKINFNLWTFINNAHYGYDNYARYTLGSDYTRHIFDRRLIRITNRQIERSLLERIVRQKLRITAVDVRDLQTDKRIIRVVVPRDGADGLRIRKHRKEVVRDMIAPGFAEKRKVFKGQTSKNKDAVSKIFNQGKLAPKVENLSSEQIINRSRAAGQKREQSRKQQELAAKERLVRIEKEGRFKEPKKEMNAGKIQSKGPQSGSKLQKADIPKHSAGTKYQQQKVKNQDKGKQQQAEVEKRSEVPKQKQQQREMEQSPQKEPQRKVVAVEANPTASTGEKMKSDKQTEKKSKAKTKAKSKPRNKDQEKDKD